MKGVVFTEFLDLVETRFSANMVNDILQDAELPSSGAYTTTGTYPESDMVAMVVALSLRSRTPIPNLLRAFGEHLFGRFVQGHPGLFKGMTDTFEYLAGMENLIHNEVRQRHPDAQLPRSEIEHHDPHHPRWPTTPCAPPPGLRHRT